MQKRRMALLGAGLFTAVITVYYGIGRETFPNPDVPRINLVEIYHVDTQNPCEAILDRMEYGFRKYALQQRGGFLSDIEGSFWYENGICQPSITEPPQLHILY